MNMRFEGVIVRISHYTKDRQNDHVDVRLVNTKDGSLVSAYRNQVTETGPQECEEESWRRDTPENESDRYLKTMTELAMKIEAGQEEKGDAVLLAQKVLFMHGFLSHGVPFPAVWMRHRK